MTKTFDSRLFANSFQLVCNKFYYYEPLQHTQGSRANKIASSRFSNRSGKACTGKSISIVVLLFVFFNLFVFFVVFLFFLETFTYHWHRYERRNIQSNLLRFVLSLVSIIPTPKSTPKTSDFFFFYLYLIGTLAVASICSRKRTGDRDRVDECQPFGQRGWPKHHQHMLACLINESGQIETAWVFQILSLFSFCFHLKSITVKILFRIVWVLTNIVRFCASLTIL